jgi:hypothetical protein
MTYMVNSGRNDRDETSTLPPPRRRQPALRLMAGAASAQEIRFMCYSDGNECEVYDDVIDRFEAENKASTVAVDVVPYQAILENLPVQLAAGEGPDLPRSPTSAASTSTISTWTPYVDAVLLGRRASAARSTGIAADLTVRASTACTAS